MPVLAYWQPPASDETSVSVRFEDADFERIEEIHIVVGENDSYNESLTTAAIQDRCVELEQEIADGG